jgi:D-erythronate 2-dehydrogenase
LAVKILILGAGGMLGRKLTAQLATSGKIGGAPITHVTLHDVVAAVPPVAAFPVVSLASDFSGEGVADELIAKRPDVIVVLASIVSGEAEQDFEKGYRINLDGTRLLLEAIRLVGNSYRPRVIFSSSIAVFGAPFPEVIEDDYFTTPLTSYGTQKAICELLISDYTRRGFVDGVSLRFPTLVVRPGLPNKAASGFFSNIIREPLAGKTAVLPVGLDVRHWVASPRAAIKFIMHAASMDLSQIGPRRSLNMPGLCISVGEMIDALREVAGQKAVNLLRHEPDEFIQKIVAGWPVNFDAKRAQALGFEGDSDFVSIIRAHIDEELGRQLL